MSETDSRLLRRCVDDVLWHHWDPIGVNDTVCARDEYDNYIDGVVELVRRHSAPSAFIDHLRSIEVEQMGLARRSDEALAPIAQQLAELAEEFG